jgi:hypothetical protein
LTKNDQNEVSIEWLSIEKPVEKNKSLKRGIWVYFILLIFEGAIRKWVLPSLSTPLLIIRDPVALWLILMALRRGLLPYNKYMVGMAFIGVIGTFTALFMGHGNLAIALFGARILLLHFPLIFVIGNVFDRNDVEKIGKTIIYISIPMVLLIAAQFYSPQSAWVNRGIGGDLNGGGFDGAMGYFRPPGTFSFTNGNVLFFALDGSIILYFWLTPNNISRVVLIAATIGLTAAMSLSISRTLFFSFIVSVLFAGFTMLSNPKLIARAIIFSIMAVVGLAILNETKFFKTSAEAFGSRYENANQAEGGTKGVIGDRYLGGLTGALVGSRDVPFFGYGMGLGTNVGAQLLSGKTIFLISEGEWGRLIGELGPLLGILVIFIRLALIVKLGILSFRKLGSGNLLPWMLLSFGALIIPQGQWAQPTNLGFAVLSGGLIIAAMKNSVLE